MDYWSTNFYKANNERAAAILDKVKRVYGCFWKPKKLKGNVTSFYTNMVFCLGKVNMEIPHHLLPKLKKRKPF